MQLKKLASASVALATVFALAGPVAAQTPSPVTGPILPGVCVFNPDRAIGGSTVGGYLKTRLTEINGQINAELQSEATQLQTEDKALEATHATLSTSQYQAKRAPLEARAQALQRKNQLRQAQFQLTKAKAVRQIELTMGPIAQQTFAQRGCSVLLDAQALDLYVPGAEITDSVIAGLNAKIQSLPIELVTEQDAIQAIQQQQQQGR